MSVGARTLAEVQREMTCGPKCVAGAEARLPLGWREADEVCDVRRPLGVEYETVWLVEIPVLQAVIAVQSPAGSARQIEAGAQEFLVAQIAAIAAVGAPAGRVIAKRADA